MTTSIAAIAAKRTTGIRPSVSDVTNGQALKIPIPPSVSAVGEAHRRHPTGARDQHANCDDQAHDSPAATAALADDQGRSRSAVTFAGSPFSSATSALFSLSVRRLRPSDPSPISTRKVTRPAGGRTLAEGVWSGPASAMARPRAVGVTDDDRWVRPEARGAAGRCGEMALGDGVRTGSVSDVEQDTPADLSSPLVLPSAIACSQGLPSVPSRDLAPSSSHGPASILVISMIDSSNVISAWRQCLDVVLIFTFDLVPPLRPLRAPGSLTDGKRRRGVGHHVCNGRRWRGAGSGVADAAATVDSGRRRGRAAGNGDLAVLPGHWYRVPFPIKHLHRREVQRHKLQGARSTAAFPSCRWSRTQSRRVGLIPFPA